jgi:hypothetical protein
LNFKLKLLKPIVTQQSITLDELKTLLAPAGARDKAMFLIIPFEVLASLPFKPNLPDDFVVAESLLLLDYPLSSE